MAACCVPTYCSSHEGPAAAGATFIMQPHSHRFLLFLQTNCRCDWGRSRMAEDGRPISVKCFHASEWLLMMHQVGTSATADNSIQNTMQ